MGKVRSTTSSPRLWNILRVILHLYFFCLLTRENTEDLRHYRIIRWKIKVSESPQEHWQLNPCREWEITFHCLEPLMFRGTFVKVYSLLWWVWEENPKWRCLKFLNSSWQDSPLLFLFPDVKFIPRNTWLRTVSKTSFVPGCSIKEGKGVSDQDHITHQNAWNSYS